MKSPARTLVLVLSIAGVGCNAAPGGSAGAPESLPERAGYAIGFTVGGNLAQQNADVDAEQVVQGLRDALAGRSGALSPEELESTMMEFQQSLASSEEARRAEEGSANLAVGEAFLEDNATKAGIVVLDSGLQYEVIDQGDGASPAATDQVTVHYEGRLVDGTVFDSSYEKGAPATFPLNRVISGWTEGVQLMNVGGKYRFFIPAELGYGLNPPPGSNIGVNSALIFEVELLAINGQS